MMMIMIMMDDDHDHDNDKDSNRDAKKEQHPSASSSRPFYFLIGGHLTSTRVTFSPSQKGHERRIAGTPGIPVNPGYGTSPAAQSNTRNRASLRTWERSHVYPYR